MNMRNAIKVAVVLVIAGAAVALYFSPLRAHLTREHIGADVALLRGFWYAPIILIGAYAIGCIFALPASMFIIAAGVVWGWKLGTVYAMCGAMLGATLAYFVGRFLGEGLLQKFGRTGQAVETQVASAGFKTMVVVRLIPGPPFAVWNYAAGVAGVAFADYFFGTLVGTLPAHLIFAYSADALFNGTMTQGEALKRLIIVAVLMLALVLLPGWVAKRSRAAKTP
jgi:uncharacterized membrane protein YdjX (TVP38/TMEM64 family)